ncbi:MAG TPA: hypothetical protein VHZ78_00900 [Rhizomicrobium sp.]|jgi:hypothetical protein|nr:hypothetical protein [Rhizomicrobium sp.]
MANENGNGSEPSPLWYAVGAFVLIVVMMGTIVALKPLPFTPPVAACEGEACARGATAPAEGKPEGVSHAAGEHAPEGASHEAPPAHPE